MHRHLVTIKVRVIGRTDQRVQLDRLSFNQYGFESLDPQSMQRWCTIQQYGVFTNNFIENIPHLRLFHLDHFFGLLNR